MIYPQLSDAAWLQAQVDAGLNDGQIAAQLGCTKSAVVYARQRCGVLRPHTCAVCGITFTRDYYRIHVHSCKRRQTHADCQYCGKVLGVAIHPTHEARCHANPTVREATRRLLDAGDGTIVSSTHYRRVSLGTQAISAPALRELYGAWAQVAQEFGLAYGESAVQLQIERGVVSERTAIAYERQVLESEQHRGLPVCGVRQVGREVYCMLR